MFVDRVGFQRFIVGVIVVNAVTLGLETSPVLSGGVAGETLNWLDRTALTIFVVELVLRLYAHRASFFRDPWSVFDFAVVAIALIPASGPLAVMRTLRVLRVLRLVSRVDSMRRVVSGLLRAMPAMASTAALLGLVIYIAAVIATKLFSDVLPAYFGHLGTTLFTLFQVMTGEAWPEIANQLMVQVPWAWIFFVIYILVSSFMVLNLFIAVVVNAMEREVADEQRAEDAVHEASQIQRDREVLDEVRGLRAEVAELRRQLSADEPGEPAAKETGTVPR